MLALAIKLVFVICSKDITQTYGAKLEEKINENRTRREKTKQSNMKYQAEGTRDKFQSR
jgi:hypothetical protein